MIENAALSVVREGKVRNVNLVGGEKRGGGALSTAPDKADQGQGGKGKDCQISQCQGTTRVVRAYAVIQVSYACGWVKRYSK